MKRIWIAAATVALLGFGAAVVTASEGGSDGATTTAATATTTETQTTPTTTTEDRPRREHERDRGAQAPAGQPAGAPGAVDISGPCDEAEHANDPRCTGGPAATGRDDDGDDRHRGRDDDDDHGDDRGGDDDHGDDDHGDDDSSGRGGNSGPGGGDRE